MLTLEYNPTASFVEIVFRCPKCDSVCTAQLSVPAPDFTAETTYGPVCLDDYKGKWLVLFSHPGDFTPVCTTEMIAFAQANHYFEKLNTMAYYQDEKIFNNYFSFFLTDTTKKNLISHYISL